MSLFIMVSLLLRLVLLISVVMISAAPTEESTTEGIDVIPIEGYEANKEMLNVTMDANPELDMDADVDANPERDMDVDDVDANPEADLDADVDAKESQDNLLKVQTVEDIAPEVALVQDNGLGSAEMVEVFENSPGQLLIVELSSTVDPEVMTPSPTTAMTSACPENDETIEHANSESVTAAGHLETEIVAEAETIAPPDFNIWFPVFFKQFGKMYAAMMEERATGALDNASNSNMIPSPIVPEPEPFWEPPTANKSTFDSNASSDYQNLPNPYDSYLRNQKVHRDDATKAVAHTPYFYVDDSSMSSAAAGYHGKCRHDRVAPLFSPYYLFMIHVPIPIYMQMNPMNHGFMRMPMQHEQQIPIHPVQMGVQQNQM